MSDPTPQPLHPEDPEHAGDRSPENDEAETGGVGTAIDPADPLKREGEDDMPGLDPVVPVIPAD